MEKWKLLFRVQGFGVQGLGWLKTVGVLAALQVVARDVRDPRFQMLAPASAHSSDPG